MIAAGQIVAFEAQAAGPAPGATGEDSRADAPVAVAPIEHLDHRYQFGLSVMPGIGYRVIARYNDNQTTCLDSSGDDSKVVCTNKVPFFLDLQASFGLGPRIDLITDVRLGLGKDAAPGVGKQFALAPGLRVWLDQDVQLKLFTTFQVVFDNTKQGQPGIADRDFGLRNANGLMYDPIRNVGFYVQFGETVGFVRWLRIELDVGLGVQVRFP